MNIFNLIVAIFFASLCALMALTKEPAQRISITHFKDTIYNGGKGDEYIQSTRMSIMDGGGYPLGNGYYRVEDGEITSVGDPTVRTQEDDICNY